MAVWCMCRVGQNHICTAMAYIRYYWQGNHQCTVIYGVYIYGSGQPHACVKDVLLDASTAASVWEGACLIVGRFLHWPLRPDNRPSPSLAR